jgi:hypothetical protein
MFNKSFFFGKSYRLWDKVEKCDRATKVTDDNISRRMRFAFWIDKATDTRTKYVIFMAFPRQKWLRERNSVFRL